MSNDAGKRRLHDSVSDGLPGQNQPRTRAKQRLVLLHGSVPGDVELPPRDLCLRAPLIELGLRQELLVEQHLRAVEVALSQRLLRAGIGDFRHAIEVEIFAPCESQSSFELRGVGLGLGRLRLRLGGRDANEIGALGHARAALDRRCDHPPLDLGSHLRLFFGSERAGHFQKPRDRLLRRGSDGHADGRGLGRLRRLTRRRTAPVRESGDQQNRTQRLSDWLLTIARSLSIGH